jgi:hypothetical protein
LHHCPKIAPATPQRNHYDAKHPRRDARATAAESLSCCARQNLSSKNLAALPAGEFPQVAREKRAALANFIFLLREPIAPRSRAQNFHLTSRRANRIKETRTSPGLLFREVRCGCGL